MTDTTHDDLTKQADAFRLGSRPTDADVDKANWLIDRMSARIDALTAERDALAEKLEMVNDVRRWQHYPIEMPLSKEGQGPATVGVDAATISYEVWDQLMNTHASFANLPDAINEAMRLNANAGDTP